jgi:hypothetical protein
MAQHVATAAHTTDAAYCADLVVRSSLPIRRIQSGPTRQCRPRGSAPEHGAAQRVTRGIECRPCQLARCTIPCHLARCTIPCHLACCTIPCQLARCTIPWHATHTCHAGTGPDPFESRALSSRSAHMPKPTVSQPRWPRGSIACKCEAERGRASMSMASSNSLHVCRSLLAWMHPLLSATTGCDAPSLQNLDRPRCSQRKASPRVCMGMRALASARTHQRRRP